MIDDFFKDYFIFIMLNGILLFFYDEISVNIFLLDVRILKGFVRKILVFKDNKFEGLCNDLFNKILEEIVKFV